MDKYKRLASNTVLFFISSFSSKVLVFLLMPYFTAMFDSATFGDANLVTKNAQLLLPIVGIGIGNAVIRFGLDKAYKKESVFTSGVLAICIGTVGLFLFWPLIRLIPGVAGYTPLVYGYVIVSVLQGLCSQFVRAQMHIRLYAFDGILRTVLYLAFVFIFLSGFGWGIEGYVLATIASDFCSMIFLFFTAKLHEYFQPKGFDWKVFKEMLRYSVPLIPTSIFWWITNASDHQFVTFFNGSAANGLYEAAYRVPNILILFSTLFSEAWQLSAVTDGNTNSRERSRFFSKVFLNYQGLLFMAAAGMTVFSKVIMTILAAESYYSAWAYIPLLLYATLFSCLSTFVGSVYVVEKKSSLSFVTMLIGAVLNIVFNLLLIPDFGPNGAAFATFISYFVVFVIRAVNSQKYVKINYRLPKFIVNTVFVGLECYLMVNEVVWWPLWCGLITAFIVAINLPPLWVAFMKMIHQRRSRKTA